MTALRAPRPVLPKRPRAVRGTVNPWLPSWLGVCPACTEALAAKRAAVQQRLAEAGALIWPKGVGQ